MNRVFFDAAEAVLEDVRQDLKDMSQIVSKIANFKRQFPHHYKSSFMDLSLPQLLSPFVMLDIIPQNIIQSADGIEFNRMSETNQYSYNQVKNECKAMLNSYEYFFISHISHSSHFRREIGL